MKVTVIGHWGAYPEANGATSGYLIESKGFRLLVDCGSAVISKLHNYITPAELDAVLLSHYHHDHIADIGPLQYARMIQFQLKNTDQPLPIYGHMYDEEAFLKLSKAPYTKGIAYDPEQVLKAGPFEIEFLRTKHPVICFAFKITDGHSTIVYSADSSFIEEFISFANNVDLFICECNFYKGQNGANAGHMNSIDAATIAKHANAQTLLLTHLPHFGNHQDLIAEAKEIFQGNVNLAESGWVWEKKTVTF